MIKFLAIILLLLLLNSCSSTQTGEERPELGVWDLVADYCDEIYEFREDYTSIVLSPPERTVDTYTFRKMEKSDFYHWTYRVVEYNEKASCNGTYDTYLGQFIVAYVKFKNNNTEMHIYQAPHEDTYIGGYLKKR